MRFVTTQRQFRIPDRAAEERAAEELTNINNKDGGPPVDGCLL